METRCQLPQKQTCNNNSMNIKKPYNKQPSKIKTDLQLPMTLEIFQNNSKVNKSILKMTLILNQSILMIKINLQLINKQK